MDHLEFDNAVLAGFSLGVQIILEFYNLFPSRANALIIITGPYENPLSTFYGLPVPTYVWEKLLGTMAHKIPNTTNRIWQNAFKLPVVHQVAKLIGSTRASAELMQDFYQHQQVVDVPNGLRMALASINHSARHVLPKIKVPTMVIGGEKDLFTPVKLAYIMRDEIPEVDFIMIPQGTHTTLIERPDLVNAAVWDFMGKKVVKSPQF